MWKTWWVEQGGKMESGYERRVVWGSEDVGVEGVVRGSSDWGEGVKGGERTQDL